MQGYEYDHEAAERLFRFIEEYIETTRLPPSRRDMMAGARISSTSMVQFYLHKLIEQGRIELVQGISRGIRLVG